jgi:hypothetical protein
VKSILRNGKNGSTPKTKPGGILKKSNKTRPTATTRSSSAGTTSSVIGNDEWQEILDATEVMAFNYKKILQKQRDQQQRRQQHQQQEEEDEKRRHNQTPSWRWNNLGRHHRRRHRHRRKLQAQQTYPPHVMQELRQKLKGDLLLDGKQQRQQQQQQRRSGHENDTIVSYGLPDPDDDDDGHNNDVNVQSAIVTFQKHARSIGVSELELMVAVRDDDRSIVHVRRCKSKDKNKKVASTETGKSTSAVSPNNGRPVPAARSGGDRFLEMYDYYFGGRNNRGSSSSSGRMSSGGVGSGGGGSRSSSNRICSRTGDKDIDIVDKIGSNGCDDDDDDVDTNDAALHATYSL